MGNKKTSPIKIKHDLSSKWPSVFQFGPGLCFYPEFGVLVRSSEKGPGHTLVRSSGLEIGERIWPNPGSAGLEKGTGRTLVWQVRS